MSFKRSASQAKDEDEEMRSSSISQTMVIEDPQGLNVEYVNTNGRETRSKYFFGQTHAEAAPEFKEAYKGRVTYFVCQQENGEKNGRLHWQFYMEVNEYVTPSHVRKWFKDDSHLWVQTRAKTATNEDAINYVKKQADTAETRIEWGQPYEFSRRRQRLPGTDSHHASDNDYDKAIQAISSGRSFSEVMVAYPRVCMRYEAGMRKLRANFLMLKESNLEAPTVSVHFGPTRTGKTHAVWKEIGEKWKGNVYWLKSTKDGRLWFDGYDGEECLVIDDFEGNMRVDDFLHLTDRYVQEMKWEYKGGMTRVFFKHIFITSNSKPTEWYKKEPYAKQQAVMARLSKLTDYSFVRSSFAQANNNRVSCGRADTSSPDAFLLRRRAADSSNGDGLDDIRRAMGEFSREDEPDPFVSGSAAKKARCTIDELD